MGSRTHADRHTDLGADAQIKLHCVNHCISIVNVGAHGAGILFRETKNSRVNLLRRFPGNAKFSDVARLRGKGCFRLERRSVDLPFLNSSRGRLPFPTFLAIACRQDSRLLG
jgi:hypothetical protein